MKKNMLLAIIENMQREDLNPMEEAQSYQRLQEEFGLSQEQIADKSITGQKEMALWVKFSNCFLGEWNEDAKYLIKRIQMVSQFRLRNI